MVFQIDIISIDMSKCELHRDRSISNHIKSCQGLWFGANRSAPFNLTTWAKSKPSQDHEKQILAESVKLD